MEVRRAADVFLRSHISPFSTFLNPSAPIWARRAQLCPQIANRAAQRTLRSSTRQNALKPEAITSATPATKGSNTASETVEELSKTLWASRPARNASSPLSPDAEKRMNGGDSAVDILEAINKARTGAKSDTGLSPSRGFDAGLMLDPIAPLNDNRSIMQSFSQGHLTLPQTPRLPMRLKPSTGRSVTIGTGIDVARGLRLLEQSCARNKIRADATKQRFHERGGLKRKRLRRERWRRRFLEGFKATVGRVRELKNQGW